jgi:hypothetical protein
VRGAVHGNLPAPVQTLERLRGLGERAMWIRGNTDRLIVGDTDSDGLHAWVAEALGDDYSAFLGSLPLTQCLDVDGLGDTLFCPCDAARRRDARHSVDPGRAAVRRRRGDPRLRRRPP